MIIDTLTVIYIKSVEIEEGFDGMYTSYLKTLYDEYIDLNDDIPDEEIMENNPEIKKFQKEHNAYKQFLKHKRMSMQELSYQSRN